MISKKDVAEIKRRFKKDDATFSRLCGCYVNGEKEKVYKWSEQFLNLDEEEFYKYLEIAGKCLSGTLENNLLPLEFPKIEEEPGGRQQVLMALRDTGLMNEDLVDTYYDLIIDTYDKGGNYLILLFEDAYDVMVKTTDKQNLDESEEVFTYLLCAICPVDLSKPALGYREDEKRIGARIRDWVVGMPESAFMFPAFEDRSANIHSCLFYTKNTKEPHAEFISNALGCPVMKTKAQTRIEFESMVKECAGKEDEEAANVTCLQMQQAVLDAVGTEGDKQEKEILVDGKALKAALSECKISEQKMERLQNSYEETFGKAGVSIDAIIDEKKLEANTIILENHSLKAEIEGMRANLQHRKRSNGQIIDEILSFIPEERQSDAQRLLMELTEA